MKTFRQFLKEDQFPFSAFLVARLSMPQIKNIPHFINYINHLGIKTEEKVISNIDSYSPTQFDFDQDKVDRIIEDDEKRSKPILVSSDGYILDGHHSYQAASQSGLAATVIEIDLNINKALKLAIDYVEHYG